MREYEGLKAYEGVNFGKTDISRRTVYTLEWFGNESLKGSTYSMREYDEKHERELKGVCHEIFDLQFFS